jgi:hypothetical protein
LMWAFFDRDAKALMGGIVGKLATGKSKRNSQKCPRRESNPLGGWRDAAVSCVKFLAYQSVMRRQQKGRLGRIMHLRAKKLCADMCKFDRTHCTVD